MLEIIIAVAVVIAWVVSLVFAHSLGERQTSKWIFHRLAWGQYRGSGHGIINDHGNCIDHGKNCPYD